MKYYKDPANQVFAYEADGSQDGIIAANQVPITQAEADSLRFGPQTVAAAQAMQIAKMVSAYQGAIAVDVSFTTAAAVTKLFQADANSVANAQAMLAAYKAAVPAGFYWVAKDNTQVPFTLADLQGLAKAMGDQGWAAFQNLQARKASILAATTITAVQAIAW